MCFKVSVSEIQEIKKRIDKAVNSKGDKQSLKDLKDLSDKLEEVYQISSYRDKK